MLIFIYFFIDFTLANHAASREFEEHPLSFLLSTLYPLRAQNSKQYSVCGADSVFQQLCPGTHGGIENLMRLF